MTFRDLLKQHQTLSCYTRCPWTFLTHSFDICLSQGYNEQLVPNCDTYPPCNLDWLWICSVYYFSGMRVSIRQREFLRPRRHAVLRDSLPREARLTVRGMSQTHHRCVFCKNWNNVPKPGTGSTRLLPEKDLPGRQYDFCILVALKKGFEHSHKKQRCGSNGLFFLSHWCSFLLQPMMFLSLLLQDAASLQCTRSFIRSILFAPSASNSWTREHSKNRTTSRIVTLASSNFLDKMVQEWLFSLVAKWCLIVRLDSTQTSRNVQKEQSGRQVQLKP